MGIACGILQAASEATRQLERLGTSWRRRLLSLHRGHLDPGSLRQASELSCEDTDAGRRSPGDKVSCVIICELNWAGANERRKISEKYDKVFVTGCLEPDTSKPRANAAFVVLARNKELDGVIQSMKSIERHFNRWYNYPYVFLNDGDFNSTFKETVKNYTNAKVEFGKVGPDMWGYPDWVDTKVAKEGIAKQGDAAVMYGGLESYHSMCRFYSG